MKLWRAIPRSKQNIWRLLNEIQSIKLDSNQKIIISSLSKLLACMAGKPDLYKRIYKRIYPKSEEDIKAIEELHNKIINYSIDELRAPAIFCNLFLNFKPTTYQIKLLEDSSKRIGVRACRQSGKSLAIGAKIIHFNITNPCSRAINTAPSFRQAKQSFRKMKSHIANMNAIAKKAWVTQELKTIIRYINNSEAEAVPYALERLRGDTCDLILVDEAAFIPDDEELFEGVLFPMIATRWENAQIIASSTPWSKNNYFYRIFNDAKIKNDWSHQVWTWRDAVNENVIPKSFINNEFMSKDPNFFKREYEAEFLDDKNAWLTLDLINCCLDVEERFWSFDDFHDDKELYFGLDLGKKVDHSVLAIIEKVGDELYLRHVKIFPLETHYSSVIGYVKALTDKWKICYKVLADVTREEYFNEEMKNIGIPNYEGKIFNQANKADMAIYLKQCMQNGLINECDKWVGVSKFHIPYEHDRALESRIIAELNVERYELTKDGTIKFYHNENSHDDVFWAIALACYASRASIHFRFFPLS